MRFHLVRGDYDERRLLSAIQRLCIAIILLCSSEDGRKGLIIFISSYGIDMEYIQYSMPTLYGVSRVQTLQYSYRHKQKIQFPTTSSPLALFVRLTDSTSRVLVSAGSCALTRLSFSAPENLLNNVAAPPPGAGSRIPLCMSIRVVAFGRSTGRWETFPAAGVKTDSQRLFPLAGPPARFMPPFLLFRGHGSAGSTMERRPKAWCCQGSRMGIWNWAWRIDRNNQGMKRSSQPESSKQKCHVVNISRDLSN